MLIKTILDNRKALYLKKKKIVGLIKNMYYLKPK